MPVPFRIKVCGVTRLFDLQVLADAGVDAVGLNFVPTSPRCLTSVQGVAMKVEASRLGLRTVAVVMNLDAAHVRDLQEVVAADFIQLHGSESPEVAASLPGVQFIKAVSWSGREEEAELVERWQTSPAAQSGQLAAFLVDAFAPGVGGGTGRTARWDLLVPRPVCFGPTPIVLAGGLNADNVAAAVNATNCDGVDTASGVESQPGIKDATQVQLFAQRADTALEQHA